MFYVQYGELYKSKVQTENLIQFQINTFHEAPRFTPNSWRCQNKHKKTQNMKRHKICTNSPIFPMCILMSTREPILLTRGNKTQKTYKSGTRERKKPTPKRSQSM
uniref:Uncharacterized protein n=1 Tax=Cacopsylla melanoneura TaxID=428564 RepID=A0A8D8QSC9_9HEMI